ncbi:TetR/AcrR family transcriptional regulator [Mycolicibacterium hodleri]|uniref:TetR/AcrR family transcriptional regulator n=1 Tax=Mycolicibacterium hodleri TaxID=49897 RepID=A0A502EF58_9MYCO|nr:TetR/AcrR family transcriptional regulator [Mycolicibacterium hodleri]TPG35120.1 TetR/AcrR family transcriptional regulator [Mycolicibacterium hodleri]
MSTPRRRSTDTYHHGNLRTALLEHAVELARVGGPDAVKLRDVQRLAGVSNSAAYRHYSDRHALLGAVTEVAQTRLADQMTATISRVPDDGPRESRALARLRATGQAYVEFALAEPGLFRTAFAFDPLAGAQSEVPTTGERHPFQILVRCIDDVVAAGILSPDRRDGLDEAAWAAVHGLATLLLDGPLGDLEPARRQLIIDRLLDTIEVGLA